MTQPTNVPTKEPPATPRQWDYLIVTASNDRQGSAYRWQLDLRRELGLLADAGEVLVVPDPQGRRVGSGGSTIQCLLEVLRREIPPAAAALAGDPATWLAALKRLRILIIHAGGDSRRLPAYGPCGKIFIPVPWESDRAIPMTLFDLQVPLYLDLPATPAATGQVVITSGDVLVTFDPSAVRFDRPGMTGLGCLASPEQAGRHGVYCTNAAGEVQLFLQKPSPEEQARLGAIDPSGQAVLDAGIVSFDAAAAVALLRMCEVGGEAGSDVASDGPGRLDWSDPVGRAILDDGLDFYREVCCALGTQATPEHHRACCRAGGSKLSDKMLGRIFESLRTLPFHVEVLPDCEFLHFGTTRQIIASGQTLMDYDGGRAEGDEPLDMNNVLEPAVTLEGPYAWVEGCRLYDDLLLDGYNVVTGADIDQPIVLPRGACLDVLDGRDGHEKSLRFIRCYGADDTFQAGASTRTKFCGMSLAKWLRVVGATHAEVWDDPEDQDIWTARLFPGVEIAPAETDAAGIDSSPRDLARSAAAIRQWLWMFTPSFATAEEKAAWRSARRFSLQEMAALADQARFHRRRFALHRLHIRENLSETFDLESEFSADDLARVLAGTSAPDAARWVAELLAEARSYDPGDDRTKDLTDLIPSRILHTVGTALEKLAHCRRSTDDSGAPTLVPPSSRVVCGLGMRSCDTPRQATLEDGTNQSIHGQSPAAAEGTFLADLLPGLGRALGKDERQWLGSWGLTPRKGQTVAQWARSLKAAAFENLGRTIVASVPGAAGAAGGKPLPANSLRSDEIVWGRSPARLDFGGAWTDTPPYCLEYGGCVVNAAVDLNGQPPIQAYARVTPEPVIRIVSIDLGARVEVATLDDLLDYRTPTGSFALAKAALALSGFSPAFAPWPAGTTLRRMLETFGGGIELTTLAAIPKGSGLGTSSIMGVVMLAVIQRVLGRRLSARELFDGVLRLEQALTTGGGWQDQIGGAVGGVKLIRTEAGLAIDADIRPVPADVLDPRANGGCTLLYYTGMVRLAKNILQGVVGRYLDRDRRTLSVLDRLYGLAPVVAEAMARKDIAEFGRLVDLTWSLNCRLDPNCTNPRVEELLARVRPHVHGAKLLGAGGGGFLLMICKSPDHAAAVRSLLQRDPPNDRARFFDVGINDQGLVVTVC